MIGAFICELEGCEPVTAWPSGAVIVFGLGALAVALWVAFRG
jgi:hypothetical protein